MKVLVNGVISDAGETPIVVYLTDEDKQNIKNMEEEAHYYAVFSNDIETSVISGLIGQLKAGVKDS